jgi:hypothetical protein
MIGTRIVVSIRHLTHNQVVAGSSPAELFLVEVAGRIVLLVILKETKTTSADTRLYTTLTYHK